MATANSVFRAGIKVGMIVLLVVALGLTDWGVRLEAQASSQRAMQRAIATFDLDADLTDPDHFYDLPYPSDLRLDADGHPDLSGFPVFTDFYGFFKRLRTIASDRPKFPLTAAGYFRFSQPLAAQDPTQLIPATSSSPILLIDIDPASPERGRLFPTVAATPEVDQHYVPPYLLGVSPYPGILLKPNRQYAYVVRRQIGDASGRVLKPAAAFKRLREGEVPPASQKIKFQTYLLYKPLWETLDQLRVNRNSVVSATVFTTGDVVAETAQLSDQVLHRYNPAITDLKYAPDNRISDLEYCKFEAQIKLPQFQKGSPPFLFFEKRAGLFEFDANGILKQKGNDTVPLVITLPKTPMPKTGYPLVAYYHGSGGLSSQVVDRGPVRDEGGDRIPGRGPADVVGRFGFAAVGSALPVNPERIPKVVSELFGDRPYLNPTNPSAYRDTFRQGVFEQRLLLEALDRLEISAQDLEDCQGPTLPPGVKTFRFDTSSTIALGQSQGAQYAVMMAAVEPKIKAVVPTGSGGFWALLFSSLSRQEGGDLESIANLLGDVLNKDEPLDHLYPALRLLQSSWEAAEPMVYMARMAKNPLPNHPVRSIYQPVGQADSAFPEEVFDAVALATGVQQAGPIFWQDMQTSLALDQLDGLLQYPVEQNLKSEDGRPYTGLVVQFQGDDLDDSHTIFSQLDDVKFQYGCFIDSFRDTKRAVVPEPKPILLPCNFGKW
ncbi:MAG: hypothetical protein WBA57_17945 [Elainellaceae cyanobacterium]